MNSGTIDIHVQILVCWLHFFVFIPSRGIKRSFVVALVSGFWKTSILFSITAVLHYTLSNSIWVPFSLKPHEHLIFLGFFFFCNSHCKWVIWYLIVVLIYNSMTGNDVKDFSYICWLFVFLHLKIFLFRWFFLFLVG
jgi:hypothetical protein